MVKIELELSDDVHSSLCKVVDACNASHRDAAGATSHGELSVEGLLTMLAEDASMTRSRPGSWEASNMQRVFDSHGYLQC